jgi:hypothetical protein
VPKMTPDEITYLRWHIAHLVRVWTALAIIRRIKSNELIRALRDACSNNLRNWLYELAHKKNFTLGFSASEPKSQKRLFGKLMEANKWFEGERRPLHYRNASGSHLQSLDHTEHIFQQFGFRQKEWKYLTKGVAACVAMTNRLDDKPNHKYWREVRRTVEGRADRSVPVTPEGKDVKLEIPIEIEALLLSHRVEPIVGFDEAET